MSTQIDLDSRLRSAGNALHDAVDELPLDPPAAAPRGSGYRRPFQVAAAVLAVAALVGAALALQGDSKNNVSNEPDDVPFMILDQPPEGRPLTGGTDLPVQVDLPPEAEGEVLVEFRSALTLYDVGGADLAVLTFQAPVDSDDSASEDYEEPVAVRGTTGGFDAVAPGIGWGPDLAPLGSGLSWREGPGVEVTFLSRTLSRDQLLAVAEDATGPANALVPGAGVAGETPTKVGGVREIPPFGLPLYVDFVGHMVVYEQASDDLVLNPATTVATIVAEPGEIALLRWWTEANTPTTVRGHDGWIGSQVMSNTRYEDDGTETDFTFPMRTLIWEESDGVYTVLQVADVSDETLRSLAESARPATKAEKAEIAAVTLESEGDDEEEPPGTIPEGGEEVDWGDLGEGYWRLYLDSEGELCGIVYLDDKQAGDSCGAGLGAQPYATAIDNGDSTLVFGIAPADALVTAPAAEVFPYDFEDGTTLWYYAITIEPGEPVPTEVTFLDDAGGKELSSVEVDG